MNIYIYIYIYIICIYIYILHGYTYIYICILWKYYLRKYCDKKIRPERRCPVLLRKHPEKNDTWPQIKKMT